MLSDWDLTGTPVIAAVDTDKIQSVLICEELLADGNQKRNVSKNCGNTLFYRSHMIFYKRSSFPYNELIFT